MATGELGQHSAPAQWLVQVGLSQEHEFATILPQLMEEQPALEVQLKHKLATHSHALP